MIRVELVYEHRSAWAALAQRWGAIFLGTVSACALLYLLPVNRWLEDRRAAPLPAEEVPAAAAQAVDEIRSYEDAVPAPVPESASPVQREQPAIDVEPAAAVDSDADATSIVLPPIGESIPIGEVSSVGEVERVAAPSVTVACFSAVAVASAMPAEGKLGLLSCFGDGRYELSGTVESSRALSAVEASLADILEGAAFSSEKTGDGAIHFFITGQSPRDREVALAARAQAQARAFFARVEYWADLCGIDDISLGEVSALPVDEQRLRWRRRLVGTGSYGQIDALLARMATAGETAGLAELILTPVSGAGGRDRAVRLSGAIDVVVHR